MTDYLYPTSEELSLAEQDLLPRLMQDRLGFQYFPPENSDDYVIAWEQADSYVGLQAVRGLDGAPSRVKRTGAKHYVTEAGTYGEFTVIPESEITRRRPYGVFSGQIDVSDLVANEQRRLLQRRLDRQEYIIWTLMATGTFSVSTPAGAVAHTDSYTTQTFSASVSWGTSLTATPLADLRAIQLLGRGHSVMFDQTASAIMSRITANKLFANTNPADIYGRRTAGLGTFNSPDQVNALFTGDGLPKIVIYDQGYLNDSGTFVPFVPDNTVIVVGTRPGNPPLGSYKMVRNASNPGAAPGPYTVVKENQLPTSIEVHDGHNGGVQILYPSSIVVASV